MIPYGLHEIDDEDISAVIEVLKTGPITQGELCVRFGSEVAKACGARFGLAVSSATAGLHLTTFSLDLQSGDEVIMAPLTFSASANSVRLSGGEIRLVDVDSSTWNIDTHEIEAAVNSRTKAIMPVDFRGHPANLGEIRHIADRYGLSVIEDAAHSFGSTYTFMGEKYSCGDCRHADFAICSFHPVKHITTGEGGVILCNDESAYERIRRLSQHGLFRSPEQQNEQARAGAWVYDLQEPGFNYRLTEFQAALGLSQLKKRHLWKERRREIVNFYIERFAELEYVQLPPESSSVDSNFHIFVALIKDNPKFDRFDVFKAMSEIGYAPMVHYMPISYLHYYKTRYQFKVGDFPHAEEYYRKAITLPLFPSMSDALVEKVVSDFREIIERLSAQGFRTRVARQDAKPSH